VGDHPVKVPAELLKKLLEEFYGGPTTPGEATIEIANKVAQWAADQELEACCEYLQSEIGPLEAAHFRAARRPKPPTLAEQALKAAYVELVPEGKHGSLIISALNRLAELEANQ
jgi:hypothetical protein